MVLQYSDTCRGGKHAEKLFTFIHNYTLMIISESTYTLGLHLTQSSTKCDARVFASLSLMQLSFSHFPILLFKHVHFGLKRRFSQAHC